jgi:hypothetical protein
VDTGYATPILVPNVPGCPGAQPVPYPAPTLRALSDYGFSAVVEIEPHEWEKNRILRIVYPDQRGRRIRPDEHFAAIMLDIRQEAAARYGPENVPGVGTFASRTAEQKARIRNPTTPP